MKCGLKSDQVLRYRQDGVLHPIKVMNEADARALRNRIESLQRDHAAPTRLFEPHALALYDEVMAMQSAALTEGASQTVALYGDEARHV